MTSGRWCRSGSPALYFGTTRGQLRIGRDGGEEWSCLCRIDGESACGEGDALLARSSKWEFASLEVREQQVIIGALRDRDDVLRRQVEERVADLLRRRGRVALEVQGGHAG